MSRGTISTAQQGIVQAAVHTGLWVLAAVGVGVVLRHGDARLAYSLVSGWWAALYGGYVFGVRTQALPATAVLYLLARIGDSVLGLGLLYHDPPLLQTPEFLLVVLLGYLLFVSPILLNELVRLRYPR